MWVGGSAGDRERTFQSQRSAAGGSSWSGLQVAEVQGGARAGACQVTRTETKATEI